MIDEAGQFSLASTIAVSLASARLLLSVTLSSCRRSARETHPEPVGHLGPRVGDRRAPRWCRPSSGYFLARTRRMHPAVAAPCRVCRTRASRRPPSTALRSLAVSSRAPCRSGPTPRQRDGLARGGRGRGRPGRRTSSAGVGRSRRGSRRRRRDPPAAAVARRRHHRDHAVQRAAGRGGGGTSPRQGSPTCRSGRSTGSRARRRWSRSSRSRRPPDVKRRGGWSSCSCATASTSPSPGDAGGVRPVLARPARRPAPHSRGRRASQRLRASGRCRRLTPRNAPHRSAAVRAGRFRVAPCGAGRFRAPPRRQRPQVRGVWGVFRDLGRKLSAPKAGSRPNRRLRPRGVAPDAAASVPRSVAPAARGQAVPYRRSPASPSPGTM